MLLGRMIMRRSRLNRLPVNLVVNVCCELITLNCIHKCHYFYPLLQQLSCLDNDNDNNNDDNNNNNNNSNNNNNNNNNSNNNNNNNNNDNNNNDNDNNYINNNDNNNNKFISTEGRNII